MSVREDLETAIAGVHNYMQVIERVAFAVSSQPESKHLFMECSAVNEWSASEKLRWARSFIAILKAAEEIEAFENDE